MKENLIENKTFEFSLPIIKLFQNLTEQREFIISKQLLKSGTSIGANVVEAEAAQSKADFIAKMSIASKEARETKYWLELLAKSNLVVIKTENYLEDINSIIRIITSIIKSSRENN